MMYSKQSEIIQRAKWLFSSVFLLTLGVVVFSFLFLPSVASDDMALSTYAVSEAEVSEEMELVPELPVRLIIPAIAVDAEVQYVGLDLRGSGEMAAPSNFTDVGWYKYGVRPGMRGSAVIAGHVNGYGVPEAVFYDLGSLEIGDEVIVVSAAGVEDIFLVVHMQTYAYNAPTDEVFVSDDGTARLNLITCSGEWMQAENQYNERTVVFTERVISD